MKTTKERIEFMRWAVCEDLKKARSAYVEKDIDTLDALIERISGYFRADIISDLAHSRAWNMYLIVKYGEELE